MVSDLFHLLVNMSIVSVSFFLMNIGIYDKLEIFIVVRLQHR